MLGLKRTGLVGFFDSGDQIPHVVLAVEVNVGKTRFKFQKFYQAGVGQMLTHLARRNRVGLQQLCNLLGKSRGVLSHKNKGPDWRGSGQTVG